MHIGWYLVRGWVHGQSLLFPIVMSIFGGDIEGIIFDLDGTLVESELLKARSYARVAQSLCDCSSIDRLGLLRPDCEPASLHKKVASLGQSDFKDDPRESPGKLLQSTSTTTLELCFHTHLRSGQRCADASMRVFRSNIGATSQVVAQAIVDELSLDAKLNWAKTKFGVTTSWEAFYLLRKQIYYEQFATEQTLWEVRYEHNLALLHTAHKKGLPIGVATSSLTSDANRVLKALKVFSLISAINGRDQVQHPKPASDIYRKTAADLGVDIRRCIVVEDSVNGLKGAVASGALVIAVANDFTRESLRDQTLLDQKFVVYNVDDLETVVKERSLAL